MAIKLTIDEGNSSTKVALWQGDVMMTEVTRRTTADALAECIPASQQIDAAILCTVCGRSREESLEILNALDARRYILDSALPLPVSIGYKSPQTLGADRIAAAAGAAAIAPGKTALIVDMGTAITYDVITADGLYMGGNIAPGIFVRLEALNHFTKALPLVETDGDTPRWGYDTETALRSGAIRGVVGELQYYRHCLAAEADDTVTILTGGSADLIIPYITTPTIIEPNLVMIGLNSILNYNENQR